MGLAFSDMTMARGTGGVGGKGWFPFSAEEFKEG